MNEYVIIASTDDVGRRVDSFLQEKLPEQVEEEQSFSRTRIQKLIAEESVLLGENPVSKNYRMAKGDVVRVFLQELRQTEILPENIPLDILYEDSDLLVVDKPKGMVVHPAAGHDSKTLVNALMYHCKDSLSGINGEIRPGIVHRIDKDTSGLLVVAKTNAAHLALAEQLADHSMERQYHAVCHGVIKEETGMIDRPIGRDRKDRKRFSVDPKNGKSAVTRFSLIENYERYCYVTLRLETGRTHQIRVHMASIGHPVAGDTVYGPKSTPKDLQGQCLHAKTLGFIHPKTGEKMRFDSALPEYFTAFIRKISGREPQ